MSSTSTASTAPACQKSGHTPGPWKLTHLDGKWSVWGLGSVVAQTQTTLPMIDTRNGAPTNEETAEANARLIASAPDLLAALKAIALPWAAECDARGERHPMPLQRAIAAIAAAKGVK